ncbi:EboA domain-containing protein [Pontibacter pudoricolor]|uniref:EboA domain-containing protein n=1 Tax=Pontibacter pudoricolor TaxID=2694930 RepID=UPI001391D325|nr:EboA domain-containing protein [Pontibacter pudoricolor]
MYSNILPTTIAFLEQLFNRQATPEAAKWLKEKKDLVKSSETGKELYLPFSAAPRYVGKSTLSLTQKELEQANQLRKGFTPRHWTTDQLARTILLLSLPHENADNYSKTILKLFGTADMGELVALYAALPLLPHPEKFVAQATEGIRTNMGNVYEAIALNNPYPSENFTEAAWNQMVLKTIFTGKSLQKIYGLDERTNSDLARMLSDYAHERWAAGRTVTPELWRPVGPHINQTIIRDIKKLFASQNETEHEAAALACAQSGYPEAQALLNQHPLLKLKISEGQLNWSHISQKAITA